MKNKMITAEELINKKYLDFESLDNGNIWTNIEELMQQFAKLHVQECKKEIIENGKVELAKDCIRKEVTINPNSLIAPITIKINKNSILNAYNLDNIK
jgi:hypothetical protein